MSEFVLNLLVFLGSHTHTHAELSKEQVNSMIFVIDEKQTTI